MIATIKFVFFSGAFAISLAAGYEHTCALVITGSIFCWGSNSHGQLGSGDTTGRYTPLKVLGLEPGECLILVTIGKIPHPLNCKILSRNRIKDMQTRFKQPLTRSVLVKRVSSRSRIYPTHCLIPSFPFSTRRESSPALSASIPSQQPIAGSRSILYQDDKN
jgi:hypothetical protein